MARETNGVRKIKYWGGCGNSSTRKGLVYSINIRILHVFSLKTEIGGHGGGGGLSATSIPAFGVLPSRKRVLPLNCTTNKTMS